MAYGVDRYPDPSVPRQGHREYDRDDDGNPISTYVLDYDDSGNPVGSQEEDPHRVVTQAARALIADKCSGCRYTDDKPLRCHAVCVSVTLATLREALDKEEA